LFLPGLLAPERSASAAPFQGTPAYLPYLVNAPPVAPTPTATLEPGGDGPVAGHWSGATSRGYEASFEVDSGGNQWSDFSIETDFTAPGCASGTMSVALHGPGEIEDDEFEHTSGTFQFSGRFDSQTTASGTYEFDNYQVVIGLPGPPFVCIYYLTQSGDWSANAP
jgi:hypothetical protein